MYKYVVIIITLLSIILCSDKLYIDKISFENNYTLSNKELYEILKLKTPKLFSRSEFSHKIFNHDIQNLIGYYNAKGFLDVSISGNYDTENNHNVHIIFIINEGARYQFNKLEISGNKYLSYEDISHYFHSGVGNHYNSSFVRSQIIKLKKEYLRNGKLDIQIHQDLIIDGHNITLRINISEGTIYKINKINISGLESVLKKYVDREVVIKSGNIYNIDRIDIIRRRIFDSGLFSSVEIYPEIVDNIEGIVDIVINVREYKSSSIEADFGFSEISTRQNPLHTPGFDIGTKWVIGNIMNTPSKIIITGSAATEIDLQSLISNNNLKQIHTKIIYKTPWTLSFKVPTELRLFYEIDNDKYENLKTYGFSHLIYFKGRNYTRYDIRSTYEIVNAKYVYSNEETEPARSIEFSYTSNNIRNIINPTGGYFLRLSSTLFGTLLGGKRDFLKINNEFRKYFKITLNSTIAFRYKMGYIYSMNKVTSLPKYYKFELGGQSSMRGWSNTEEFDNSGGKLIYDLVNLEYRLSFYKKWGGELFIDMGRLYNDISYIADKNFSWNYGIGITYDTALGPVRIEYALPYIASSDNFNNHYNLDRSKMGEIHVSLLYMF